MSVSREVVKKTPSSYVVRVPASSSAMDLARVAPMTPAQVEEQWKNNVLVELDTSKNIPLCSAKIASGRWIEYRPLFVAHSRAQDGNKLTLRWGISNTFKGPEGATINLTMERIGINIDEQLKEAAEDDYGYANDKPNVKARLRNLVMHILKKTYPSGKITEESIDDEYYDLHYWNEDDEMPGPMNIDEVKDLIRRQAYSDFQHAWDVYMGKPEPASEADLRMGHKRMRVPYEERMRVPYED